MEVLNFRPAKDLIYYTVFFRFRSSFQILFIVMPLMKYLLRKCKNLTENCYIRKVFQNMLFEDFHEDCIFQNNLDFKAI